MKQLILVFAAIAINVGAFAQAESTNRKIGPPVINNNDVMNQNREIKSTQNQNVQYNPIDTIFDGVMMQNGKMMMVKNGQSTIMDHDMTMSNGTKIMSDGTCITKDGVRMMMKEGQQMEMSGNMIPMKTNEDKNMDFVPDSTMKLD